MNSQLKAIEILKKLNKAEHWEDYYPSKYQCNEAIAELESLESQDRLAELEKVILDYYLGKGYQVGVGHWNFNVEIDSLYKSKTLKVKFVDYEKEIDSFECKIEVETTKEMFDKAIEYFKIIDKG